MNPEGDAPAAAPRRTAGEIRRWLKEQICELLGVPVESVDGGLPFANFGLDSARMYIMLGELAEWLGVDLSPAILLDYPSIDGLARRLGAAEAAARIEAAPRRLLAPSSEPIAIVGIGCRYPGDADDPDGFWRVVASGASCIGPIPSDRWDADSFYSPDPATRGSSVSRVGGFLRNVTDFDAQFFGISPREAPNVDPQQRILLETAWEALEDAGIPAEGLAGSATGVFVGYCYSDFTRRMASGGLADINPHSITGLNDCIGANRISYFLDLRGPSMVLHSASSSSLVAIHQACMSLWMGECDLALAGGITLALSPAVHVVYTKAGAMSPTVCRPFDADTRGMARGEGGGLVVLRPLSAALAAGDRIYAVVRGSAVAQDGRTNGLAAPNQEGIEHVMRMGWARAGLAPSQCQYVEAHGTGTVIGDLVEGTAICRVVGEERAPDQMCRVGSIKANIGHPEAGAGVAGVIKVALALHHRQLPPTIHVERPNPEIPWERSRTEVQTRLGPWPSADRPLLAGVNSLGLGGTNAHVVLGEPPPVDPILPTAAGEAVILPISARSTAAVRALAERYLELLAGDDDATLDEIAASAALRRGHLAHRIAVVASDRDEAAARLRAHLRGETRDDVIQDRVTGLDREDLLFVYSGQGSQWAGMGMELMVAGPTWQPFQDKLRECDRLLRPHVGWSVIEELARPKERSSLDQTAITQPALFCIQTALTAQWAAFGLRPAAVIGHSFAEVTAAHVAGALELEEALALIAVRSRLMHQASGRGRMLAAELTVPEAEQLIAGTDGKVVVAAANGPRAVSLSGEPDAIEEVAEELTRQGVFHRRLRVSTAFHSPLMEPFRAPLEEALASLRPRPTEVPMISSVTGLQVDGRALAAPYWGRNLREPIHFTAAIDEARKLGYRSFLEVSPHPILTSHIADIFEDAGSDRIPIVLGSLRQGKPELVSLYATIASLWSHGDHDPWRGLYPGKRRFVSLPTYAWQRRRWWSEPTRPWAELIPVEEAPLDLVDRKTQELPPIRLDADDGVGVSPLLARLAEFGLRDDPGEQLTRAAYEAAPAGARRDMVLALLRRLAARGLGLGIDEVDPERSLRDTGIDSISVAQIRQGVRAVLGSAPSVSQFFDGSSLDQLATRLVASRGDQRTGSVAAVEPRAWVQPTARARTARIRLFCLAHAGAGALSFRPWSDEAAAAIEVLPVHLPGREDRAEEAPLSRVQLLIPALTRAIASHADRPYAVFGHSLGALIAFELVRELRRMRVPPPVHLFASAARAPHLLWSRASGELGTRVHRMPDAELIAHVARLGRLPAELVAHPRLMAELVPVLRADYEMLETYVYTEGEPLSVPITALGGQNDSLVDLEQLRGWATETRSAFGVRLFGGDHFYHLDPAVRPALIQEVSTILIRSDGAQTGGLHRQPLHAEVAR